MEFLRNQYITRLNDWRESSRPDPKTEIDEKGNLSRNSGILLRKVMRGQSVTVHMHSGDTTGNLVEQLPLRSRGCILTSLLLYTARNDRAHGDSASPFTSGMATTETYTHPHFMFIATYYLLLSIWEFSDSSILNTNISLADSLRNNLQLAESIYGSYWRPFRY